MRVYKLTVVQFFTFALFLSSGQCFKTQDASRRHDYLTDISTPTAKFRSHVFSESLSSHTFTDDGDDGYNNYNDKEEEQPVTFSLSMFKRIRRSKPTSSLENDSDDHQESTHALRSLTKRGIPPLSNYDPKDCIETTSTMSPTTFSDNEETATVTVYETVHDRDDDFDQSVDDENRNPAWIDSNSTIYVPDGQMPILCLTGMNRGQRARLFWYGGSPPYQIHAYKAEEYETTTYPNLDSQTQSKPIFTMISNSSNQLHAEWEVDLRSGSNVVFTISSEDGYFSITPRVSVSGNRPGGSAIEPEPTDETAASLISTMICSTDPEGHQLPSDSISIHFSSSHSYIINFTIFVIFMFINL